MYHNRINSEEFIGGCEFDSRLRQTFFPAYFRPSPLQKHVRKVVGGSGKKVCDITVVRKPGNTLCFTNRHDMTLAVKMALNPNTTNQPRRIYTMINQEDKPRMIPSNKPYEKGLDKQSRIIGHEDFIFKIETKSFCVTRKVHIGENILQID